MANREYSRKLIDYLPNFMKKVREIEAIMTIEDIEVSSLWKSVDDAFDDQYIETATEHGISRREKILGIVPQATSTLDERKFTIKARENEQLPFTIRALEDMLKGLCGQNGVSIDVQGYKLFVRVELTAKKNFADVGKLLGRVVPANMAIDLSLKYNQHGSLNKFTHGQLSKHTHDQLRNEVMI